MGQPQLKRHGLNWPTLPIWDIQVYEHSGLGQFKQLVSSGVRVSGCINSHVISSV